MLFPRAGAALLPAHRTAGLAPHCVSEILLIMSRHNDVATTFDRKAGAVREHASQFSKHPDLEGFLRRFATRTGGNFDAAGARSRRARSGSTTTASRSASVKTWRGHRSGGSMIAPGGREPPGTSARRG